MQLSLRWMTRAHTCCIYKSLQNQPGKGLGDLRTDLVHTYTLNRVCKVEEAHKILDWDLLCMHSCSHFLSDAWQNLSMLRSTLHHPVCVNGSGKRPQSEHL